MTDVRVSARPTVFLFDIDGTLLLSGGAGRRAFERALLALTGRPDACDSFSFAGMTDRAIARQALTIIGREPDERAIEALCAHYLDALREELPRSEGFAVLRGAEALVTLLRRQPGMAVGLGTGNLKRGAQAKLSHCGLWPLFDFGGFGCDHEDRGELLRIGALRGAQQLGQPLSACRVVVIGDTVRDVVAARAIAAECITVCTSGTSREALLEAGAHHVFGTLDAPGLVDALLPLG